MELKVKDLKPNPFRRLNKYKINKAKVESLKISIKETSFWDNLLVRNKNGVYEIAYGHHRLVALKELGIEIINVPVRELDDVAMIKIMANENMDDWKNVPAVYTETVLVAKEYLDGELAKYETWDEFRSNKSIRPIFESEPEFRSVKGKGVGQTTILKFLGGNWKQHIIQDALNTLKSDKEGTVSKKAIDLLPSAEHSKIFKTEVKKYDIPKSEQEGLAKTIARNEIGKRATPDFIETHAKATGRIKPKEKELKPKEKAPNIDEFVEKLIKELHEIDNKVYTLIGNTQHIESNKIKDTLLLKIKTVTNTFNKVKEELI